MGRHRNKASLKILHSQFFKVAKKKKTLSYSSRLTFTKNSDQNHKRNATDVSCIVQSQCQIKHLLLSFCKQIR